ncbi:MAG: hypothetical protein ACREU3_19830, partial [Steroidobacteraceae bacterium]
GDKPPLYFWLLAAGFELTGSIRWTFLLPSLLAALGIVGLTYDRPVVDFGHRRGLDPLAEAEDASRWLDAAPRRVLLVPRAVIRGACCTTRRRPARLPILRSAIAERVWYFPAASLKTPIASKDPR